jgi:hypothetical protein
LDQMYAGGIAMYPDTKDFAVNFVQNYVEKKYMSIMYAMKAGKTSKEALVEMIQKSLSTQTKINESRWMWGDLKWVY